MPSMNSNLHVEKSGLQLSIVVALHRAPAPGLVLADCNVNGNGLTMRRELDGSQWLKRLFCSIETNNKTTENHNKREVFEALKQ